MSAFEAIENFSIDTNARDVFLRRESNVRSYARAIPAIFTKAIGSEIWDDTGKRYLDFLAGAGSLNFGHNNPVLKRALIDYIANDGITTSLDLHTEAKRQFLLTFESVILNPRGHDYVVQFTGPTGTNAVEAALKLARKITGRTTVVHFTNSFHGASLGALSVTGNKYMRRAAGIPLHDGACIPFDGYLPDGADGVAMLERMLLDESSGIETPAAVIVETVQGEGGLNVASQSWLSRLAALCERMGVLLIVDDIQTGCGRTGTFFSFEPAGIEPDIVTLSKSLSGFGLPMSLVLVKRKFDQWKPGEHNGTFRGNNHAFVTATAMLEEYWATPAFADALSAKAAHLTTRLQEMVDLYPGCLARVKGRGLMQGIAFRDHERARAVAARAFERGLIIERCGPDDEVVKCMPPLTIPYAQLDEGLDILKQALGDETVGPATVIRRP